MMPLLVYGIIALLGAGAGVAGTVAATDAADDIGNAAEKTGDAIQKVMITGALIGAGYFAVKHWSVIRKVIK